jgi:hypothetical protein
MSSAMSQPKYLLLNDEIIFTSLIVSSKIFVYHGLLTLWRMFTLEIVLTVNSASGRKK